jgi:protein-S-isoprenylcysteine O-methyltransferase Ste14
MKKLSFLLLFLLSCSAVFAQAGSAVQMDDALRSNGKIYVVITIICIIFAGLAIFLFSIDRRLKKIEKGN